jgi:hypothetical protein
MSSFLIQTVKFIFKQSNLNLNGSITRRHITTTTRPQQDLLVRTVMTTRNDPNTYITIRLHQPATLPPFSAGGQGGTAQRALPLQSGWAVEISISNTFFVLKYLSLFSIKIN